MIRGRLRLSRSIGIGLSSHWSITIISRYLSRRSRSGGWQWRHARRYAAILHLTRSGNAARCNEASDGIRVIVSRSPLLCRTGGHINQDGGDLHHHPGHDLLLRKELTRPVIPSRANRASAIKSPKRVAAMPASRCWSYLLARLTIGRPRVVSLFPEKMYPAPRRVTASRHKWRKTSVRMTRQHSSFPLAEGSPGYAKKIRIYGDCSKLI